MRRLLAALALAAFVTVGLAGPASATTYTAYEGGAVNPAIHGGDTLNLIMSHADKWVFNPVTGQYELHNWYRRCYDYGGYPWAVITPAFHGAPARETDWCYGVDF